MRKPRIGSLEHRDLFCRTFIETHRPFEPEDLPWPRLEARYVDLLRAFPFWSFARSMEQEPVGAAEGTGTGVLGCEQGLVQRHRLLANNFRLHNIGNSIG